MGLSPNSPSLALTWMYLSWRVAQCTDKSFQYIQCQAVGGLIAVHAWPRTSTTTCPSFTSLANYTHHLRVFCIASYVDGLLRTAAVAEN
ncbi:hypothetical protein EV363DRAFT_1353247, partial [Boletus edulis]